MKTTAHIPGLAEGEYTQTELIAFILIELKSINEKLRERK